jgi:hypothetical protein
MIGASSLPGRNQAARLAPEGEAMRSRSTGRSDGVSTIAGAAAESRSAAISSAVTLAEATARTASPR